MHKPIIWLASYPKSGNTWLRLFLAAYVTDGPVDPNNLPRLVCASDLKTYSFNAVSHRPISQCTQGEFLMMRPAALMHEVVASGSPHPFVKTHHKLTEIDGVELFPDFLTLSAIYIMRDPRDVCVSFAKFLDKDIDFTIKYMCSDKAVLYKDDRDAPKLYHYLGDWSSHVDSWMRTPFDGIALRYEDLLERPEKEFGALCHFLGFDEDPDRLHRAIENTGFKKLSEHEDKVGFAERSNKGSKFFSTGKSGGWRDILTKEQEQKIIDAHGEVMRAVGYLDKEEKAA